MAQDNDRGSGLSPEIDRLSSQLAKDPKSKLFIPLAEEYMKADMAEEAVMTLEEGLKAHPAYMSARVLLGKAHLLKGDMDKACEQFENVIKAVPDNLFALRKLGEIYIAQGRRDEALKNLRILAILSPKDEELNGLIGQLESGQLPPSPLVAAKPAPAEEEAAKAVPEQAAPTTEPAVEEFELEAYDTAEQDAVGSAPTYEITDDDMGGFDLMAEAGETGPEDTSGFELDLGAGVPEPEVEQPSPFDIASEIPYQPGDNEPAGLGSGYGQDEAGGGMEGFLEPDAGEAPAPPDEDMLLEPSPGPGTHEALEDIFASYSGQTQEEASVPGESVYELEEPSDLDLEELGVKTTMAPAAHDADRAGGYSSDMPFEVEGESDATMPEGPVFDLDTAEEAAGSLFEDALPAMETPVDESPFELAGGEDAGEEPFPSGEFEQEPGMEAVRFEAGAEDVFGEEHEASPFDMESEAVPFEIEAEVEAEAEPEASPFDSGEFAQPVFGQAGEPQVAASDMEPEPAAEEDFGEVLPEPEPAPEHEPFRTDTLAEMYIRQGFYDRAISIYKEMIRENPGDMSLKQKLEELYMLAGVGSAMAASAREAESQPVHIEPADFVQEWTGEPVEAAQAEIMEAAEPVSAGGGQGGEEAVIRLERFLDNIKRKGRQ